MNDTCRDCVRCKRVPGALSEPVVQFIYAKLKCRKSQKNCKKSKNEIHAEPVVYYC